MLLKPKLLEWILIALVAALLALAVLGPPITQPADQHAFADQRMWANIPYALDVLSNAAFALFGILGLVSLTALVRRAAFNTEHALAGLFFTGLIATAAASSWYHLQPDDAGLGIDRLGMVVAFASLLGLAVAGRVSRAAGVVMTGLVLLLGPLSIWFWLASGNALPWLVIQFGGILVILMLAFIKPLPRAGVLTVRWAFVICIYAVAKLLELGDHPLYALTNEFVSGHSLKHLVASLAAWPVIAAIQSATQSVRVVASAQALADAGNMGRIRVTISDSTAF